MRHNSPYKLHSIDPKDVVRILVAVGLDAEARGGDGIQGELPVHLLALQDLPSDGGRPEQLLHVLPALVHVGNHQLQLAAGEHRAHDCSHLEM